MMNNFSIADLTALFESFLDSTVPVAEHSKAEGISMNQYCLYLLTKNDATYHAANAD